MRRSSVRVHSLSFGYPPAGPRIITLLPDPRLRRSSKVLPVTIKVAHPCVEAALGAGPLRFRPIIMTASPSSRLRSFVDAQRFRRVSPSDPWHSRHRRHVSYQLLTYSGCHSGIPGALCAHSWDTAILRPKCVW